MNDCKQPLTDTVIARFGYPPKWCTYSASWSLHGRHVKLAAVSAHVLCTPYDHAPVYSVTSCETTFVGCICVIAATCHLHLWQNERDLLRATAVTLGWNGYRVRRVRRESWAGIESCFLCVVFYLAALSGLEPATFHVRCSTTEHSGPPRGNFLLYFVGS